MRYSDKLTLGALAFTVFIGAVFCGLFFMLKKALCLEKAVLENTPDNKRTAENWAALSVLINILLAAGTVYCTFFGNSLISPVGLFVEIKEIHIDKFVFGIILILTAIFLPSAVNIALYEHCYGKKGLSKRWISPSALMAFFAVGWTVFAVIYSDFIDNWAKVDWI
ncbi:MAG: hypothetical protein NC253_06515 [Ruminococcus sp.]|nr:hypothetical protein [Ruminococcus sp.]MCM1382067.1 hypothetical protein [Muribaculaceae bacterium]MCM1480593.1 hypothetical protein [Muribaculaceae bacterium]